jgi:hypothetical protein
MFLSTNTRSRLISSSFMLAVFLMTTSRIQAQAVLDQQQPTASDVPLSINSGQSLAQTVTAGLTGTLTKVRMPVSCSVTAPTNPDLDGLVVEIQGVTSGGIPNGTVLTSQKFLAANLPGAFTLSFSDLVFSSPIAISAGQKFAIVLKPSTTTAGDNCFIASGPGGIRTLAVPNSAAPLLDGPQWPTICPSKRG